MKKLWVSLLIGAALTVSAGAADVGTIDNGYPGDTEAQAQMLCDLGLFRGTENGFELEKPMTRAEAAAMLTRFLGAEQEALAGEWEHPFTDVPQWAEPYVGWLYESGLTKGVSETVYGAGEDVTCGQYCTFLARASTDEDYYDFLLRFGEREEEECDKAGFVRGDAVSLSARLLGEYYTKYNDLNGWSVAEKLIDRGVFTKEQFRQAAWDVLPRQYGRGPLHGIDDQEYVLSCEIAGVPVVYNDQTEAEPIAVGSGRLYGEFGRWETQGPDYVFYRIDPATLEVTELGRWAAGCRMTEVGYAGGTDYFVLTDQDSGTGTLYAVCGDALEPVPGIGAFRMVQSLQGENGCVFQTGDNTFYRLDGEGLAALPVAAGGSLHGILDGDLLVMENITPARTVISGWTWDGAPAGSYTVENQYPMPDNLDAESLDYWCSQYAPKMLRHQDGLAWGTAGLYRAEAGELVQITDRPVYDCAVDPADSSYVLLTSPAEERPGYYGAGVYTLAGTEAVRIAQDGTETMLLTNEPAHGLNFDRITCAEAGEVRVQYTYVMGMADYHSYEYAIENGKLRALLNPPGRGFSGYTEEEREQEQARLDELGVGVNS